MTNRISDSPRISLVALVRDESLDLGRLLAWHRELYDEAIVVDTGSRDASVAVATRGGARVTSFAWCDDFSAARNHGLALAKGQWVLVLDCDELVAKQDFEAIRQLCATDATAWEFQQRNYCAAVDDPQWVPLAGHGSLVPSRATGFVDAATCRLFPRRDDVRYEGVVHELPNRSLTQAGIPLRTTGIIVHHYGHLVNSVRRQTKKTRYASLLRQKLHKQPEDPTARYEMAVQLVTEGQEELARRLLLRAVTEAPEHGASHRARLLLGRLLLADGQAEAGLAQMETAVRDWPGLREGWVDTARVHTRLGQYEQAARYIRQGRYLFPADPVLLRLEDDISGAVADNE